MNEFKAGDKIKCIFIPSISGLSRHITLGNIYEINGNRHGLYIICNNRANHSYKEGEGFFRGLRGIMWEKISCGKRDFSYLFEDA